MKFSKENPRVEDLPQVKVKDIQDISEENVTRTLRRAINFHSTIQSHDGHWAGDYGGPMFLMPGLVSRIFNHIFGMYSAVSCWKLEAFANA